MLVGTEVMTQSWKWLWIRLWVEKTLRVTR
jgi:hypothetical protein